jgi:hypothetical protein
MMHSNFTNTKAITAIQNIMIDVLSKDAVDLKKHMERNGQGVLWNVMVF